MPYTVTSKTVQGALTRKVREISGEDPTMCFQCGLCAGSCPMTGEMEIYTRKMMHMLQLGLTDAIISRKMAYLCASCYTCQVRCPRGIDIPRVVEAVRLITLREGENFIAPEDMPKARVEEMPQAALVSGLRKFTG